MEVDPSEEYDVAKKNPEIVEELRKLYEEHKKNMVMAPPLLDEVIQKKPAGTTTSN